MKRIAVIFLLFRVFFISAAAQTDKTRPRQVEQKPTTVSNSSAQNNSASHTDDEVLKVETSLVTIPVTVLDRNGRFVTDLQQQNFKIFEDGKEQEIALFGTTEQPITVALVLDTSPSTELRIEQIQNAAITFVNQLKPNDRVTVIEFDANVHVLCEPTNNRARLEKAIRKADFGDGTALFDAIENVIYKRFKNIEGRKAIVIFTDGVDTASYKADDLTSLDAAEKSGIPIYPVYYNTINDYSRVPNTSTDDDPQAARGTTPAEYAAGRKYLIDLTAKTGGRAFSAEGGVSLDAAFAGIAEELRRQYNLGFYPSETARAGERKRLEVRVNLPNATVRARDSYVVGKRE